MSERGRQFLICPRCGLTIKPRLPSLTVEHCPRCLARSRVAVTLFASPLPADELYAGRSGPRSGQRAPKGKRRRGPI